VELTRLWLRDFRNYPELEVRFAPGFTALVGPNGVGKTNLLEALSVLSTTRSFRGAPPEAMIRVGAEVSVVRAEGRRDGRDVLIELELARQGRTRAQVNRQRMRRARDLLGALRTTVFTPEDLALVKEGPALRRDYLDDLLVALDPGLDRVLSDLERVLRQRAALLRQAGGHLDEAAGHTLDVWDTKLAHLGQQVTTRREGLAVDLAPAVDRAYQELAGSAAGAVRLDYQRSWPGQDLSGALAQVRREDVRRGVSTIGPHRDELHLELEGLTARTQASQGEQRTLALGLRLAGHRLVAERLGEAPLLLLDDVLSELDPARAQALLDRLPSGQVVLTSAADLPPAARTDRLLRFGAGTVREVA
jgi:DNA replication and repair protein RecF